MSRAVHRPKTREELEQFSLEQLDAEIAYLEMRAKHAGGVVLKAFRKQLATVNRVRDRRFG